jgi:hypothetical protein
MTELQITENLFRLVRKERCLVPDILRHLKDLEDRKIHLARGYPSLFAYCTEGLNYSDAEAQVRIQAVRLLRDVPVLQKHMTDGKISLWVAARAQSALHCAKAGIEEKAKVLEHLVGLTSREAERKLAELYPETGKREVVRPVSATETRLSVTLKNEVVEKLDELKALLAHKYFDGGYEKVIEEAADLALVKLRPKSKVWLRDQGRCQYKDPVTGRRCGSRYALEEDHIIPRAKGGPSTLDNLQLLCDAHNRWKGAG